MPDWLKDAVFYEIYPQSFKDGNGDGIGDFEGIIEKLDYVRELGCNAIWLNPCFDSPFRDAGYDVRDYKKAAPRYGTNEDLARLFEEAHRRGIRVLLDLVPGHTSEEHPWFLESRRPEKNALSGRYIWTDFVFKWGGGLNFISGEAERDGGYVINFFKCQPALNYGFLHPSESWHQRIDSPDALSTREAMKDIMRFWLSRGCDGFRVDMADSLVKFDDENKSGTCAVWRDILGEIGQEYPEAAFAAEWCSPWQALSCGFHMDFYLDHLGNGYNTLLRDYKSGEDHSYFKKDAGGDILRFLRDYLPRYNDTREEGYISLISCNHDTQRPSFNLGKRELEIFYAFLFTMPGVPFLYYGDEIGMRYIEGLPTREGGYYRTGTRTPMQWTKGKNMGFSEAEEKDLYLPVDPAPDAPDLEIQMDDPSSLYCRVRDLIRLRHKYPELQSDAAFGVLYAEEKKNPFVYRRGSMIIALNPSGQEVSAPVPASGRKKVYEIGQGRADHEGIRLGPQSCLILK